MKKYIFLFCVLIIALVGCDKEVSVTPPLGEPENGYVFINSKPAGSKIFLNGKNTGKVTPDSLISIEFGTANVTLKGNYFYDTAFTVVFTKDIKNSMEIDFTTNPHMRGTLTCNTKPTGAEIFINDSATGFVSPHQFLNVLPGEYKINYKKTGYRTPVYASTVSSGVLTNSYSVMQDTTVWVDYLTTNSGIPTNYLTCVEVDETGNIWVGSTANGLIFYDRTNWVNYTRANSLMPSNYVTSVLNGNNGDIFVGTTSGLVKLNNGNWVIYNTDNSNLLSNYIECIEKDKSGNIWIGTKAGLAKFDGINFTIYTGSNSQLPESHIMALAATSNGKLYIGTYYSGITEINGTVFTNYSYPDYPSMGNYITAACADKSNNVWFGHMPNEAFAGGLSCFNGQTFTTYTTGLPVNFVNCIYVDKNNKKWVGTNNGLVSFFDYEIKETLTSTNSGLNSNLIKQIKQDNSGVYWIVTSDGGLCKYKY